MRSILFSLVVLVLAPLSASFHAGGDALFWTPTAASFDYAVITGDQGSAVKSVCPGYSWGGRLFGEYRAECLRFGLSGLWFDTCDRGSIATEGILLPFNLGEVAAASGKLQTCYWNVDARASFAFHRDCWLSFELLAGVRFASLGERRLTMSGELFGNDRLSFCGAGPELGVRADASLRCGIYFTGEIDLIPLIGERKQQLLRSESLTLCFRNEAIVVPELDLRLAFGYGRDVGCVTLSAELGYELNYFYHALTPLVEFAQTTAAAVPATRRARDLGFGGPFIGLRVGF